MTTAPAAGVASPERIAEADPVVRPGRPSDFVTLTKPRLNLLVLFTTLAGLYIASPDGVPLALLAHTLIGTGLVAGGASALNQVWERDTDGLMHRTRRRPLPQGRLSMAESAAFGLLLSVLGLGELTLGVNLMAAAVALVPGTALAGPPGTWTRITDTDGVNIDEVGYTRTADNILHAFWQRKLAPLSQAIMHTPITAAEPSM